MKVKRRSAGQNRGNLLRSDSPFASHFAINVSFRSLRTGSPTEEMVGLSRFELLTPRLSSVCSNQLSYRPSSPDSTATYQRTGTNPGSFKTR